MDIIDFFRRLTDILEEYKAGSYELDEAQNELKSLNEDAESNDLNINMSLKIFDSIEQEESSTSYDD